MTITCIIGCSFLSLSSLFFSQWFMLWFVKFQTKKNLSCTVSTIVLDSGKFCFWFYRYFFRSSIKRNTLDNQLWVFICGFVNFLMYSLILQVIFICVIITLSLSPPSFTDYIKDAESSTKGGYWLQLFVMRLLLLTFSNVFFIFLDNHHLLHRHSLPLPRAIIIFKRNQIKIIKVERV